MNFESDSDIERYFELRQNGRQGDALALYNTRLRRKYPDDAQRTLLMRYYRSHDSRYHEILRENTVLLADRAIQRTSGIIALLTRNIDTVDMTDAYSVIKLAEGLLSVISPDRYQAISFSEKYVRYAKILDFRHKQMERTAELIRLYVTDTIESVQELKKEHEERRKQKVRQNQRNTQATFDLSRITFNPADVARILIPATIVRTEDIVIAYCMKYWNQVSDIAFEKTIFLYSRKFHTHHNEIFQAIKTGRMHAWKDEEILNAVLANVVTGYYYNISGDLYLQRTWARYKLSLQGDSASGISAGINALALGAATPVQSTRPAPSKTDMADFSSIARKAHPSSRAMQRQHHPEASKTARIAAIQRVRASAAARPSYTQTKPAGTTSAVQTTPRKAQPQQAAIPAAKKKTSVAPVAPFKPQKRALQRNKPVIPQTPVFVPNSIADIIRKMTGKTYTVYKELFFKSIRPSIRTVLAASSGKKSDLFGSRQNDAEEIIYTFLFEHYNDPYQNWKESSSRKSVETLGYIIPELEPIVEGWIKSNA